jgi:trehalose-6-phosphate synthase
MAHESQINGIFRAVVQRLYRVDVLYEPNHGEPTTHTNPNGSAVRNNACPIGISCSALPKITKDKKTTMSPATTREVRVALKIIYSGRPSTAKLPKMVEQPAP